MRIRILILFVVVTFSNSFSQSTTPTIIINSGANYANNIEYNTGEVYVIFATQYSTILLEAIENETKNTTDKLNEKIIVSPNPVIDFLKIIVPKEKIIRNVILYSIDGKIILNQEIFNNQIDLSNLSSGIYFLKTDASHTETFKIIKK